MSAAFLDGEPFDFSALDAAHTVDPVLPETGFCLACPPGTPYPCPVRRLLLLAGVLRGALMRTHSRLSLVRHRNAVRWDRPDEPGAIGTEAECDAILGIAAATLHAASGV